MKKLGIFLFRKDLRINDNKALQKACEIADELLCIYCHENESSDLNPYKPSKMSKIREYFTLQSAYEVDRTLDNLSQKLLIFNASLERSLEQISNTLQISYLIISKDPGWHENQEINRLKYKFENLKIITIDNNTLFPKEKLPFDQHSFPTSFSKFRRKVETLPIDKPSGTPTQIPPMPIIDISKLRRLTNLHKDSINHKDLLFLPGEAAGRKHIDEYFKTKHASTYKETRNALDGRANSTKFSIWLSIGCTSARYIYSKLKDFELRNGSNKSTYWIFFELLWREYFQWYALHFGTKLFKFSGATDKDPLTSYYPERLKKWETGSTPFPLVNALMHELTHTGYMSNRGRQIVASCFVNELQLDWRYGASFMEKHLIDYDVASNWGNWQSVAGVAPDGKVKHFDLKKQTALFDPDKKFIRKWKGESGALNIDSVDIADWPI